MNYHLSLNVGRGRVVPLLYVEYLLSHAYQAYLLTLVLT